MRSIPTYCGYIHDSDAGRGNSEERAGAVIFSFTSSNIASKLATRHTAAFRYCSKLLKPSKLAFCSEVKEFWPK